MFPEIRIRYGWLLSNQASKHLNTLWGDGTPLRSFEEYEDIAERYKAAWKPYEQKILQGMYDLLGIEFHQNTIDVYVAPWFAAFSDPMVIGVKYSDDEFIETLAHELLHRLLTDNNSPRQDDDKLIAAWESMIEGEHSKVTLIHIPVHACLKAIFLDVLNEPQRLSSDIAHAQKFEAYKKAWEYVEDHDYKEIVTKLRTYYSGE